MRVFARLRLSDRIPDATTILDIRHVLDRHRRPAIVLSKLIKRSTASLHR